MQKRLTPELAERVCHLYLAPNFWSLDRIVAKTGLSHMQVRAALVSNSIEIRPGGPRKQTERASRA